MTRRRSLLSQVQRDSYLVSRTAGDLHAAERGPKPLAKRVARRYAIRELFRLGRNLSR